MDKVYIKILVYNKWLYYIGTDPKDGTVYCGEKKSEGKILKSADCVGLFVSIREYFKNLSTPIDVELKKQSV